MEKIDFPISPKRDAYRDKYIKFTWSSHFGYCASSDKDHVPPDQTLVFRDLKTGVCAARAPNGVTNGKLLADGAETTWWAQLGDWKFTVVSTIRIIGDVEDCVHQITAPADAVGKVEVLEGSFSAPSVDQITLKIREGYERIEVQQLENVNLIHRKVKVRVALGKLSATECTFAVQHSATP